MAIGHELARKLDAREGDVILLSVADGSGDAARLAPRSGRFRVGRIFRTNFSEYDSEWIFMDREELRRLARLPGQANVVEVSLDDIRATEAAAAAIGAAAGNGYSVSDWRSMNGGLFSALAIQQTTLFLVIGLIVAVSTFNIVATLVMTVQEKKRDIGVLTALGAEAGFFSRVFLSLGALPRRHRGRRRRPLRDPDLLGHDALPAAVVSAGRRGDLLRVVHPVSRAPAGHRDDRGLRRDRDPARLVVAGAPRLAHRHRRRAPLRVEATGAARACPRTPSGAGSTRRGSRRTRGRGGSTFQNGSRSIASWTR